MALEDRVQAQRLHVFRRAEELGSVTTACREAGMEERMEEPYIEGVANHDDPESCAGSARGSAKR